MFAMNIAPSPALLGRRKTRDRLYLTSDTGFRAAIRSDIGLLVKDHIDDLAKLIAALKPC
jgi:hypothetical protein